MNYKISLCLDYIHMEKRERERESSLKVGKLVITDLTTNRTCLIAT